MVGGTKLGPNQHLLFDATDPVHVAVSAEISAGRVSASLVSLDDTVTPAQGVTTKWGQRSS